MRSIVLSIVLVAASAIPALGESTADSLAAARARLEQLRNETDATTERYETALARVATLDGEIVERIDKRPLQSREIVEAVQGNTKRVPGLLESGNRLLEDPPARHPAHRLDLPPHGGPQPPPLRPARRLATVPPAPRLLFRRIVDSNRHA